MSNTLRNYESDTPETCEAVERWQQGKINIFDEMARLERERNESLYDATQETLKVSALKSQWIAVCQERDQWQECAERLVEAFRGVPYDPYTVGSFNSQSCKNALADFRRLKEETK